MDFQRPTNSKSSPTVPQADSDPFSRSILPTDSRVDDKIPNRLARAAVVRCEPVRNHRTNHLIPSLASERRARHQDDARSKNSPLIDADAAARGRALLWPRPTRRGQASPLPIHKTRVWSFLGSLPRRCRRRRAPSCARKPSKGRPRGRGEAPRVTVLAPAHVTNAFSPRSAPPAHGRRALIQRLQRVAPWRMSSARRAVENVSSADVPWRARPRGGLAGRRRCPRATSGFPAARRCRRMISLVSKATRPLLGPSCGGLREDDVASSSSLRSLAARGPPASSSSSSSTMLPPGRLGSNERTTRLGRTTWSIVSATRETMPPRVALARRVPRTNVGRPRIERPTRRGDMPSTVRDDRRERVGTGSCARAGRR